MAVALGIGFLGGRLTAPEPDAPRPVVVQPARPVEPRTTERATPPPAKDPHGHGPPPPGETRDPLALPDVDVPAVLEAARRSRAAPDDHHVSEAALRAAGDLETRLEDDPAALAKALESFRTLADAADLETLAAVLGRIRDPQVEAAAIEVARRDVSPARRTAAFEVLDALESPDARALAVDALGRESDPEVRRAALRALPDPRGASTDDAGPVVEALARALVQDKDPELRRRAAVNLGRWHRTEAELQPVLDALVRDPSIEVRTGCAFGLESSGRRSPAVIDALVRALQDEKQDPAVREECWQALSAMGPLSREAQAAWAAFKEKRVAAGEGRDDGHDHGPVDDH